LLQIAGLDHANSTLPLKESFRSTQSSSDPKTWQSDEHELDDPKAKDNSAGDCTMVASETFAKLHAAVLSLMLGHHGSCMLWQAKLYQSSFAVNNGELLRKQCQTVPNCA